MPSIIEQIANELNVSNASVSRALNDRPGVGAELRQRILQRATELNYAPPIIARGLATSQTFGIGFFVREKQGLLARTDPFYGEILHGVEQVCSKTDYHVTISTLTSDILSKTVDFRFVRERRVDGMILAGPDIPTEFIVAMIQTGIPVVLVDNRLNQTPINCVNVDDEYGANLAAQHLIDLGHRYIGIISGPPDWASSERRVNGYLQALHQANLDVQTVHVERTDIESGEAAYGRIMEAYPNLTALCAVNDSLAIGAIRAAKAAGQSVPDELSVIGFDDIDWARLNDPPLTTVNIAKRQLGKEAAKRLLALLADPDLLPIEVVVSVNLVARASTRPL